uniref:Uncharacterized protein n=1 Tax=Nelumbo nucifera TaxID=4432 RepID=A0A822ZC49_NELNU|nr:TPA_asm: hypothetical protein HUJ06_015372 [Nelumbo nucifera]
MHPTKTVLGINAICRRIWVRTMMDDMSKNGVVAVQTLRNNIMASTLLASTAIMLSSLIAVLMSKNYARPSAFVYGDKSELGFSIKIFFILVCFLLAFLLNVQSIRYYSHASILINVPLKKKISSPGSYFWSLGLRAFYVSIPLFLWIFGPIPTFLCCVILVFMLYFLDVSFEFGDTENKDEEEGKVDNRDMKNCNA